MPEIPASGAKALIYEYQIGMQHTDHNCIIALQNRREENRVEEIKFADAIALHACLCGEFEHPYPHIHL